MSTTNSLLKALLNYNIWEQYGSYVASEDFTAELAPVFLCINSWHAIRNENKENLSVGDLSTLWFTTNKQNQEYYTTFFNNLETLVFNETIVKDYIEEIKRHKLLKQISITSYEVAEGKKQQEELNKLYQQLMGDVEETTRDDEFITDSLSDILDNTFRVSGLRWRLDVLNKSLGSLRKGDFGFIFARPETGKTTFLASEVTHLAEQIEDGCVLWINNEEVNQKVKSRVYQAALGVELNVLLNNSSRCEEEYKTKLGGKILIPNQNSYSKWDIEKLCKRLQPKLIVIDQIDKITGFDDDRDDLKLGAIYQWARELAKQYGPVIAVCQADGTGENKKWLTMANVANAKTAKQAEADWILGIGFIHDTGHEQIRYLHLSKNKLAGDTDSDPSLRHGKMQCLIAPEIARYVNI